ncbi:restriction endonuclease subunit S [Porifericola rhodea]|uniref:restriction endonuclease subunit S n=1 Tax=Porifericola rhodea TaxID=930972 RepID=UPI0026660C38|nr:restriction endonuclease subunit S [Porifericola rhodea]WKN29758.1 restriction endonuclease subunit S [Porifericola rhodea]
MSIIKLKKNLYKKTKVGDIPENWDVRSLGNLIVEMKSGLSRKLADKDLGLPVLRSNNLVNNEVVFDNLLYWYFDDPQGANTKGYFLNDGEILVNFINSPAQIGKCALFINKLGRPIIYTTNLLSLSLDSEQIDPGFFLSLTLSSLYKKFIQSITKPAINQASFTTKDFRKFTLPLPPLFEQKKISQVLSAWDEAIEKNRELLKVYLRRRKGLSQNLLSGGLRFKEFIQDDQLIKTKVGTLPADWHLRSISNIVTRVKKSFTPEPDTLYQEIGIRSHAKGIFHKEKVTGKSLGNKSVFWIEPDCFVVNIVFAWEHAIAKTTEAEAGMIASHRFPMYKPKKDLLDLDYLLYYFKSARGKHLLGLASPGGAGRNKTLGQSDFAKLQIPVPSLEEQRKIASVLSEADKEIDLLRQHIKTLKEQKKGLMQKLLTGEVRTI